MQPVLAGKTPWNIQAFLSEKIPSVPRSENCCLQSVTWASSTTVQRQDGYTCAEVSRLLGARGKQKLNSLCPVIFSHRSMFRIEFLSFGFLSFRGTQETQAEEITEQDLIKARPRHGLPGTTEYYIYETVNSFCFSGRHKTCIIDSGYFWRWGKSQTEAGGLTNHQWPAWLHAFLISNRWRKSANDINMPRYYPKNWYVRNRK